MHWVLTKGDVEHFKGVLIEGFHSRIRNVKFGITLISFPSKCTYSHTINRTYLEDLE